MTRLRCSFPAWLALAAILLIFMAPVLSQTLALAHAPRDIASSPRHAPMSSRPAGHVMATAPSHDTHQAGTHQHTGPHPAGHVDLAKCGYCSLLYHSPLMAETTAALPPSRAGPHDAPVLPRRQGHAHTPWFPNALSRAPPLSV